MTLKKISKYPFIAVFILAAVALSGCLGSGSNGDQMMPSGGEMTGTPSGGEMTGTPSGGEMTGTPSGGEMTGTPSGGEMTLTVPAGLTASPADPVYAKNSDDTPATLLPDPNNRFAPLSSTLKRTTSGAQTGTTLPNDFYIKTISGDGASGFDVAYVIGGEERSVHFGADDFDTPDCVGCYQTQDEEGRSYTLWSFYDESTYSDAYGGSFPGGNRPYFTFGARTESGNLPAGSASYFGRMYAEAYKQDDRSHDQRVRMNGRIVLTADFDEGTLGGVIRGIRERRLGESSYSSLSDTTAHFEIGDGQIVDGQFVATLTGMGDQSAPADETVLGYEGSVLGEFYGPAGEEVGGVLNASSDTHNRVLAGYFNGRQLNSTPGDNLPALSMATFVDRPGSSVRLTDSAGVTGVQRAGAGGFHVTYTVGGEAQTVLLEATDIGSQASSPYGYHERTGNRSYYLWDATGSFYNDPEFDHFSANVWAVTDWADEGYNFGASTSLSGYVVHGTPTEVADLPTGTANYSGRAFAQILPSDNPAGSARSLLRGSLALNADFGASTVGGMINGIEIRDPGQSSYRSTDRQWTIGNGSIVGGGFTADLTEPGNTGTDIDMVGNFYGPVAAEAAGILKGTLSDGDEVVRGWFGGSKQ